MEQAEALETIASHYAPLDSSTRQRLIAYATLLDKWNQTHNLIGRSTQGAIWERHILDSAQLYPLVRECASGPVLDMGTGAGLPGLVLALLGVENVHLVESNHKKASFLAEVARLTNLSVTIHTKRIEEVPPFSAAVITSRALADMAQLLDYAAPFISDKTTCIFPKGVQYLDEIRKAKKTWEWSEKYYPSHVKHGIKKEQGMIICLTDIRPQQ